MSPGYYSDGSVGYAGAISPGSVAYGGATGHGGVVGGQVYYSNIPQSAPVDSYTHSALEEYFHRRIRAAYYDYNRQMVEMIDEYGGTNRIDNYTVNNIVEEYRRIQEKRNYYNPMQAQQDAMYRANQGKPSPPKKKTCECGEDCGEKRDHHGWCDGKAKKFWQKVNKIYWSRHNKL